jgi:hypothetical protein
MRFLTDHKLQTAVVFQVDHFESIEFRYFFPGVFGIVMDQAFAEHRHGSLITGL